MTSGTNTHLPSIAGEGCLPHPQLPPPHQRTAQFEAMGFPKAGSWVGLLAVCWVGMGAQTVKQETLSAWLGCGGVARAVTWQLLE